MTLSLQFSYDPDGVIVAIPEQKLGLLGRLFSSTHHPPRLDALPAEDQALMLALADLRAFEADHPESVNFAPDRIRLSHDAAASLDARGAGALGLPPDVHYVLRTDVRGSLGSSDFALSYEWTHGGQRQIPRREGAVLLTADGPRRIPLWMKRALDLADGFSADAPLEDHWSALAAFRQALEPAENVPGPAEGGGRSARLAMTAFLRGLEVKLADRFSIAPNEELSDFNIIPYSGERLEREQIDDEAISEGDAEISGDALAEFQYRLRQRGAGPAYQLGGNSYLVIDRSAAPVLAELSRAQTSPRSERKSFIQNPRAFITDAISRHLASQDPDFGTLDPAAQEEMIERAAGPAFIETREYSERVTGVVEWQKPAPILEQSGTQWLPEVFTDAVAGAVRDMDLPALQQMRDEMAAVAEAGGGDVEIAGEAVAASSERLAAIDAIIAERTKADAQPDEFGDAPESDTDGTGGPFVLGTHDNYEDLVWAAKLTHRTTSVEATVPDTVVTRLRPHQEDCFRWQVSAWKTGLPGILNADEQGLGKTLQTIAFLNWLQSHMRDAEARQRGPVLIVAPTSLLVNWEEEVDRHVARGKFGSRIPLYGGSIAGAKRSGAAGTDIDAGLAQLDLDWLDEAIEEGRAHRYWFLTTYTTLANYQHSLGSIPFSCAVFDEIQAIKNRSALRSAAVAAMNADFRIGLTGTPIENSPLDLWTIMDRLAPGALGAGEEFRHRYSLPTEDNMTELHHRVFSPRGAVPALGLRRIKDQVARDLPKKERRLHPGQMPAVQAHAYDQARGKLASGGPGAALKMLHHIRSVSVHPGVDRTSPEEDFIAMSARLSQAIEILDKVKTVGERALVFIEHRDMQFRFAELVRQRYHLTNVDIINGDTPIKRRQQIVNRFQQHLQQDGGFDVLVLGPKAAGTGLTLTAATHVIHLSRWWNPAVEEQCNDRIHRIGQTRPVTIHIPMAIHPGFREGSFDCLLQSLMQRKRVMAARALWPMGDTRDDVAGLQQMLREGGETSEGDPVEQAMKQMFARDGMSIPTPNVDGSYEL